MPRLGNSKGRRGASGVLEAGKCGSFLIFDKGLGPYPRFVIMIGNGTGDFISRQTSDKVENVLNPVICSPLL